MPSVTRGVTFDILGLSNRDRKEEEKGEGTGGAAISAPSRRRGAEAPIIYPIYAK